MRRRDLELLFKSLDSELSPLERARLDAALEGSEDLRRIKARILEVRRAAGESAARGFGPGFADRVMARTKAAGRKPEAVDAAFDSLKRLLMPVAVGAAILLVFLAAYSLSRGDLVPKGEVYYASDITLNKVLELTSF